MIKNYLLLTWRNLRRNKLYSIINLSGLAIGLSCFLLIAIYVLDELSFDKYNMNADRIYRINADAHWGGQDLHLAETPAVTGPALKRDYPQFEEYTRLLPSNDKENNKFIRKGNDFIPGESFMYADSTFFDVFTFPAIDGTTKNALNEPHAAVITESIAKKYFGTTQAAEKELEIKEYGNITQYKIKAVVKDVPENSHIHFNVLLAMKGVNYDWNQAGNHNFYTYVLLKKGADPKAAEKNFPDYMKKYLLPVLKDFNVYSMEEFEKAGNKMQYSLMPLTKIHLYSHRSDELSAPGSIQYVYIFSVIAFFILLIACVNFMNLTTARSAGRAKEVGVRKVLGTERKQLIGQFLTESIVMVGIAMLVAIVITDMTFPVFNTISGKSMHLENIFSAEIIPILIAMPFVVGLIAGSYPAFFLSAFKPIEVLKGKLKAGTKGGALRSVLVVFQFTTSIVLIIGTMIVYRQLSYIQNANVGFDKQQVLTINGSDALANNVKAFKEEVLKLPGIKSGTITSYLPVSSGTRNAYNIFKDPIAKGNNSFNVEWWGIDYDYLTTMGMTLNSGRNFSPDFRGDSNAVIINETAAKILGYNDAVGKNIYLIDDPNKPVTKPIIGVVKNFNFESMHQDVAPLVFLLFQSPGKISFRLNTTNVSQTITSIKNVWKSMNPGIPFDYSFLNESFDAMYKSDQRVGKIALIFALLAMFIGCLGIFGLATFIAEQRTREIGIRKVLGASAQGIVQLLSKEFIRLVIISFGIAAPLSWWMMNQWLQDFAYRTDIRWWIFPLAGLITFTIALATVSAQSIRAATKNPVKSLRTE